MRHLDQFARVLHAAAFAACKGAGIEPGRVIVPVCSWREPDGASAIQHVRVGDVESWCDTASALAAEHGRNLYTSLAVFHATLRPGSRGTAQQALGIFGLGVDLDTDKGCTITPADLPIPPTLVVATSQTAELRNYNCLYLFDRLLSVEEAKPLAMDLARLVDDRDGATADAIHIWRIPGSQNWPKPSKLRRGRSEMPQSVRLLPQKQGAPSTVAPEALRQALDVALDTRDRQATPLATPAEATVRVRNKLQNSRAMAPHDPDVFDGNPLELARDLDALLHISSDCDRSRWWKVVSALHHRHQGSALGEKIARAWSRGGQIGEVTFAGAPHRFTEVGFRDHWRRGHFTVATVYAFAHEETGWNKSRARWGLSSIMRPPRPLPAGSQAVYDASKLLPSVNGFDRRDAWLLGVATWYGGADRRPSDAITIAITVVDFFDVQDGIAAPSFQRLAETLEWPYVPRGGWRRAQAAIARLAMDGWIVKSDARAVRRDPTKLDRRSAGLALCMASPEGWERTLRRFSIHRQREVRSAVLPDSSSPLGTSPQTNVTQDMSTHTTARGDAHLKVMREGRERRKQMIALFALSAFARSFIGMASCFLEG